MVIVSDLSEVQPCLLIRSLIIKKKTKPTNQNPSPKPYLEPHNYLANRIVLVTLRPISCKKGFIYTAVLHRAVPTALLAPSVFFQKNTENIELAALFRPPDHQQELLVLMHLSSCDTYLFLLCSNNHNVFLPTV